MDSVNSLTVPVKAGKLDWVPHTLFFGSVAFVLVVTLPYEPVHTHNTQTNKNDF